MDLKEIILTIKHNNTILIVQSRYNRKGTLSGIPKTGGC